MAVVAQGLDIKHNGGDDEGHKPDEMSPNVASFSMNSEDGAKAFGEAGELGTVAKVEIIVVPHPRGQLAKMARLPIAQLLHTTLHHDLSIFGLVVHILHDPLQVVLDLLVGSGQIITNSRGRNGSSADAAIRRNPPVSKVVLFGHHIGGPRCVTSGWSELQIRSRVATLVPKSLLVVVIKVRNDAIFHFCRAVVQALAFHDELR